jgi:hypothetical protein
MEIPFLFTLHYYLELIDLPRSCKPPKNAKPSLDHRASLWSGVQGGSDPVFFCTDREQLQGIVEEMDSLEDRSREVDHVGTLDSWDQSDLRRSSETRQRGHAGLSRVDPMYATRTTPTKQQKSIDGTWRSSIFEQKPADRRSQQTKLSRTNRSQQQIPP